MNSRLNLATSRLNLANPRLRLANSWLKLAKYAGARFTLKAQPRLSRVKGRSSPARGYKFGCVCSYMAGVMRMPGSWHRPGHTGTNTPKFAPPRWGRPPFDPTQTGLCRFGCGFGARWHLQESRGPPGRKPRKSVKKVFLGLLTQSLKKVPKRSKSHQVISGTFRPFQEFFETLGSEGFPPHPTRPSSSHTLGSFFDAAGGGLVWGRGF